MSFNLLLGTFANNILPILAISAAGYLLGRWLDVEPRPLGRVIFNLFTPVLVFNLLIDNRLPLGAILQTFGFCCAVTACQGLLAWLGGRAMRLERPALMAVMLTSMFGNSGNYGLPLVAFAFGEQALGYASIFFVSTSIVLNTVGVLIASLGHLDLKQALAGLFRVPTVYGVLLALVLNAFNVTLPLPLSRTVDLVASGAIPLLLVLLGLELQRAQLNGRLGPIGLVTGLRLLAGPLLGLALSVPFGLSGLSRQANVIEASMPVAVSTTVLTSEYRLDNSLVTGAVFLSTLLSPLTLTVMLVLLGR